MPLRGFDNGISSSPVFMCSLCGRGFLTAQPHAIDQYPTWAVLSLMGQGVGGVICNGEVRLYDRFIAIKMAEDWAARKRKS